MTTTTTLFRRFHVIGQPLLASSVVHCCRNLGTTAPKTTTTTTTASAASTAGAAAASNKATSKPEIAQTTTTAPQPEGRPSGSGRFLMGLGATILGILTVDKVLQYQQAQEAQAQIAQLAAEEAAKRQALWEEWKDKPALFRAKAVIQYKMGGTMGLRGGVRVGHVVDVLQEGVGPNQKYYLCRAFVPKQQVPAEGEEGAESAAALATDEQEISVGWYPMSFMEKVEEETEAKPQQQKRSKFLGLF